jgi:hypothetical protein
VRAGTASSIHTRPLPRFSLEYFVSLEQIKEIFDNVEKWSKPESVGFSIYFGARPKIRKEPKGVVLIFVPFNYPILILMSPLVRSPVICLGFHALLSLAPGGSDRCWERRLRQGL